MYTSESEFFSPEFEAAAKTSIETAIKEWRTYSQDVFEKAVGLTPYHADSVIRLGHRWNDADHVYHAMVMKFSNQMRQERGPGLLRPEEAKRIEALLMSDPTLMSIAAHRGVAGAADCDNWYLNEKDWG